MLRRLAAAAMFVVVVGGCDRSSDPVNTTLKSDKSTSAPPRSSAAAPQSDDQAPEPEAREASTIPPLTAIYLHGTWGPMENDDPSGSCETDNIVTFKPGGEYQDGGGYGRFRLDGNEIVYFDRIMVDLFEETEDRSEFSNPLRMKIRSISQNSLEEDGYRMYRCSSS